MTDGCLRLAEDLRQAGHVVHTPDLYSGKTFSDLDEGVAHAERIGFDAIIDAGWEAAERLPNDLVYAGFSLGVLPAQKIAQARAGARGALLLHSCLPPSDSGGPWPPEVPIQIHMMEADPWVLPPNPDLEAARHIAGTTESAWLFLYPGDGHLFTDHTSPDHDEAATDLLKERVLSFLRNVDRD